MLIHRPSFPVVAPFAKRLPVILVPEQYFVSPVRLDMIHNRCRGQFSYPLTLYAKRTLCQELLSCLLPLAAIASLNGTSPVTDVQFSMLVAITIVRQSRATGMLTWFLRSIRHNRLLLSYVRMRERMKDASGQTRRAWRLTPDSCVFLAIISIARTEPKNSTPLVHLW